VSDETRPILLVIPADAVEEAVRDLVRIGYDRIVAYVTPEALGEYFAAGGRVETIDRITFADVAELRDRPDVAVVDVRFSAEHASGHVPGSVNASYTRLPEYLEERIPRGKTLLVHCQGGGRAAAGAAFLAREGFDVKLVDAPFSEWIEMGDTATREPAESF
jgi:hydroxyacylglutathione hydrolase